MRHKQGPNLIENLKNGVITSEPDDDDGNDDDDNDDGYDDDDDNYDDDDTDDDDAFITCLTYVVIAVTVCTK